MRSVSSGHLVSLPDIHLRAAGPEVAITRIHVSGIPADIVSLACNEFEITRALCIAVPGAICGSSLVGWVFGHPAISVHGDKVKRAVESAVEVGNVYVEGKFHAFQLENLVRCIRIHEVCAGAEV